MRVIGRRQWPPRWPVLLLIGALTACGGSERDTAPENGDWPPAQLTVHNRAVALMGQFRYADATVLLETLAKQRPSDPMVATDLAIGILNRQQPGDPERALSLTEEVLKRYPDNRRAAYVSGLLYLYLGDLASATDRFQRVVSGDAADGHAHYFLGQSLLQSGAPQQALARFEQAVAAEPYLRSGYYGAFQALRTIGGAEQRQQELLAAYQKLERNPRAMLAEFKYTRMGPKATLRAIRLADEAEIPPTGPLFVEPQTLWESADGPGRASSITLVDLDGNGLLDIFITSDGDDTRNLLLLRDPDGSLQPAADLPFLTSGAVRAAYWGDIDNDGDTDLYLARRGANELWVKEGPVWQESATAAGVAGDGLDSVGGALFDADHDGDLDLFIVNADGPNELYSNNLDGSFRRLAVKQGIDGGDRATLGVVPADLDNDRDLDLLVIHRVPPHEVFINDRLWNYHSGGDAFADLAGAPLRAAAAMDNDVDGVPEIYGQLADGELVRWVVSETGSWGRDPLGRADPTQGPHLALFDITGDGQAEIITTDGDGWSAHASNSEATGQRLLARGTQATVWTLAPLGPAGGPAALGWFERRLRVWRPGSGRGNYLTVAPSGKSDSAQTMRSNASGIGTRLRARHGGRWSSAGGVGADSGPGQSLQPVSLGIGTAGQADFLELEWSDGVYQTELDLVAGITHRITETQRQLSSCPVMFAWDGTRYRFVSDVLGVGGLGFEQGRGDYAAARPHERFLFPEGLAAPRDGHYAIKLTEPMEEIGYFDRIAMTAYDLPPDWDMVLDERADTAPPGATGEPLFFRRELHPVSAVNDRNEEVGPALRDVDGIAPPTGPTDYRFIGRLATDHVITLDFGTALDEPGYRPVLIMDGWIEYPYAQTRFAAWQAGAAYASPSLWAQDGAGSWHLVYREFGYPAGMPRRAAVPLDRLPRGTRRLRLSTNLEIHWDRLAVALTEPLPRQRVQALPVQTARQVDSGFPQRNDDMARPDYSYHKRPPLWDTRYPAGYYTAFGDVGPLVRDKDGASAILGPGEEIHLEFEAPPSPPPGWRRRLVIDLAGWAKDMDLYTRHGGTVDPVPGLSSASGDVRALHHRYNVRYRSGT